MQPYKFEAIEANTVQQRTIIRLLDRVEVIIIRVSKVGDIPLDGTNQFGQKDVVGDLKQSRFDFTVRKKGKISLMLKISLSIYQHVYHSSIERGQQREQHFVVFVMYAMIRL